MTFDEIILLANGIVYFGLFLAYQWTAAKYYLPLFGAWLAGLSCLVFAILFFYRASGVPLGESQVVTWMFRAGVFTYCLGAAWTLKVMATPDHDSELV